VSAREAPAVPLLVQTLSRAGRLTSITKQLALARHLGDRLAGQPYRSAEGMVMRVDPADPFQVAMLTGLFSRHAGWAMREHVRLGSVVIDVGAHIGYFTLFGAQLVGAAGEVHAFEPDPRLRPRIDEHVTMNELDWVTVNQRALLDHSGEVSLALPEQLGWANVTAAGGEASAIATTLDAYVHERRIDPAAISFVKIDVEGAEAAVINGGRSTLAAARTAAVLVEHPPGRAENAGEIPSIMAGLGFSAYVPVRHGLGFRLQPGAVPRVGFDVLFLRRD
jgi:FkbM family methyltransferase